MERDASSPGGYAITVEPVPVGSETLLRLPLPAEFDAPPLSNGIYDFVTARRLSASVTFAWR